MLTTLLTGGTVVELDPARVRRADLVLHGETIGDPEAPIPTTAVVDCSGCLIMPGLVVGHTHLYSALARGMPAPPGPTRTFREILEQIWWRLDRALDLEALSISAQIGLLEAAKAGVTTVIDHHESPGAIDGSLDVLAEAAGLIGVRAGLCYGATDRHGPEGAAAGLRESRRFRNKSRGAALVRGMIGLHAPFTCSDRTLEAAAADAGGEWLHFHAAEGPDDQRAARERWSTPLFEGLDQRGLLGERTLIAHAVELSAGEAERLVERKVWVAHQARSNMNNGVGYAAGLTGLPQVVLGTDGIDNDPFAELRAAFFRLREHTGPSAWRDPIGWWVAGHRLAAQLFGQPLGALTPGAPADVVVLAYDPPSPLEAETFSGHLLFGGLGAAAVRDVFVAGRPVLRNRRGVGLDERELSARAREHAQRTFARMG